MYNFKLTNADTDSISFCKQDMSLFSKDEQESLLNELNEYFPPTIRFEHDGVFPFFVVLKAKNYIMQTEDGKVKMKGSSLKSSTMEPKLKEFTKEIITAILEERNNFTDIYHKYIKEILTIKDITPWAKKITVSTKTIDSKRANETKIIDVLEKHGIVAKEGERFYVYFKPDDSLELVEYFDGNFNLDRILEKLHKSTKRFETIMDTKILFPNYKLKKNKELLKNL
jgi:hypothetical protein